MTSWLLFCSLLMTPPFQPTFPPSWAKETRQLAKTWGMHDIAMVQARQGDIQGAKRTLTQIDSKGAQAPAEVTAVWFCAGQAIHDHPPGRSAILYEPLAPGRGAASKAQRDLPPGYLAPHPRHGAVVDFTDEHDANGRRVTARRYADGSVVIETP